MKTLTKREFLQMTGMSALALATCKARGERDQLQLNFRYRSDEKDTFESRKLDLQKTAAVVVDMWTAHGCAGATAGIQALVPKMNETLDVIRQLGIPVVFAPSGDDLANWRGKEQRVQIESLPFSPLPASNGFFAGRKGSGPFTSSCMCKVTEVDPATHNPILRCHRLQSNHHQNPNLRVRQRDLFIRAGVYRPGVNSAMESWGEAGQQELWNLVRARGITHLLYLGIATNMCIINREFGMVQARRMGLTPILIRDMTEAMTFDGYNPITKMLDPAFTPLVGTEYAVRFIEGNIGASIESSQLRG